MLSGEGRRAHKQVTWPGRAGCACTEGHTVGFSIGHADEAVRSPFAELGALSRPQLG